MTSAATPVTLWAPPARIRGTLAVVTGRDEIAVVYERFGRRLSADGYAVGVFEGDADAAAGWLASAADAPRVLVGSDTGAAGILRVLAQNAASAPASDQGTAVDAAIVAGSPVDAAAGPGTAAERTACPLHLGVLGAAASRTNAGAAEALPDAAQLAAITVPVLAIHGGADPVSPFDRAVEALSPIGSLDVLETVGGLHDALNDQQHRSVAASIVLWLERLRAAGLDEPLVRPAAVPAAAGR